MTCQFLAFCAPSVPKLVILKDSVFSLCSSMLLRIRGQRGEASDRAIKASAWPSPVRHPGTKHWNASKVYHRIKDTTLPLVKYPSTSSRTPQNDLDRPNGGTLMTTHFTAEVTVIEDPPRGTPFNDLEYPWATKHSRAGDASV